MDQSLEQIDSNKRPVDVQIQIMKTNINEKSHKCNQCDYASFRAGRLKRHMKIHSGEKSNKCNQCDFASIQAGDLSRHLKIHSGEKSKSQTSAINATLHVFRQAI